MSRDVTNLSPICHGAVTDLSLDVTNLSQICHKSVTGCRGAVTGLSPDVTNLFTDLSRDVTGMSPDVAARLRPPPVTLIMQMEVERSFDCGVFDCNLLCEMP